MRRISGLLSAMLLAATLPAPAVAADKAPTRPGHCVRTSIQAIGTRLEGQADSGSALVYANGIRGVSYDTLPGIVGSRVGDKVELCLVSIPKNCPPGDVRGKVYLAINLRTQVFWRLPDAEHSCGGA